MTATRISHPSSTAAAHSSFARLAAALADAAPGFDGENETLLRLHGVHQAQGPQADFTLRVRVPAGRLTAAQYLALDDIADRYGDGTLRLTRRQAIELGGVLKRDLKEAIGAVALARLTTLGSGGAVVRGVTAALPARDPLQRRLEDDALRLARHLHPRSAAYDALWLDGTEAEAPDDTLHGARLLPRKLEIGLAAAEDDAIDVLGHDLAFVACPQDGRLLGYVMAAGGRTATPIAVIAPDDLVAAALAAVKLFRDHGMPSTSLDTLVAARGGAWAKAEFEAALGKPLATPPALPAFRAANHVGWHAQGDGRLYLGLPVPGGRVLDSAAGQLRTALRLVCRSFAPSLLLLPGQGLVLGNVAPGDRLALGAALGRFGALAALAGEALREAS